MPQADVAGGVAGQVQQLELEPAEVDPLSLCDRPVQRRVGARRVAQPRPHLRRVVERVVAVPAVALGGDPLVGLDQRSVRGVGAQPRARRERAQLAVPAVVVDVGVRDHDLGEVVRREAQLRERGRDDLVHGPGDPGVDEQRAAAADGEPLRHRPLAERRGDAVDAGDQLGDLDRAAHRSAPPGSAIASAAGASSRAALSCRSARSAAGASASAARKASHAS